MDNRFSVAIIWNYLSDDLKRNVYFLEYLEGLKDNMELTMIYHAVKNINESGKKMSLENILEAAGIDWKYRTDVIYQYLNKPIKGDTKLLSLLEKDIDQKRRCDIYNFFKAEYDFEMSTLQ